MTDHKNGCIICGRPVEYLDCAEEMECAICGKKVMSQIRCVDGHFVCDECHTAGLDEVVGLCLAETSKDPVRIMEKMMDMEFCHMHGPEHHAMAAAALVTAYVNAGGVIGQMPAYAGSGQAAGDAGDAAGDDRRKTLQAALNKALSRGRKVPGGICGAWGSCGAGIGAGIFISVITESTSLAVEPFGLSNTMTSRALAKIGEVGGPRCCKRNSFLSILAARDFVSEKFGIVMADEADADTDAEMDADTDSDMDADTDAGADVKNGYVPVCRWQKLNAECIGARCPFNPVRV